MTADKAIVEARARIIWGEPSLSVRGFLVSNGVPDSVADAKIREFVLERATEIRRRGIKDIIFGVTVVGVCGGLFAYWVLNYGWRIVVVWFARGFIWLALVGFYGIWKLSRGVIRLVCPQTEHKPISEITE